MNSETKSVAYAFVANGVQIYLGDDDNKFVTSKLVCNNCGGTWYMNLTECFLCGSINKFLFRCQDCEEFVSITNNSRVCGNCGSKKLYLTCPNNDCISNKNKELSGEINKLGGVFNKLSGFLIAQQYCLNCGSQEHIYKNYIIRVITTTSDVLSTNEILLNSSEWEIDSYVILRLKRKDKIRYSVFKAADFNGKRIELEEIYDNFSKVVEFLYPILVQNGSNSSQ